MKIDIGAYNVHYHQAGKFIDKFQEGIKLIPFDSRNASAYDKNCGLQGTTGDFFRLWLNDGSKAIDDFIDSANVNIITTADITTGDIIYRIFNSNIQEMKYNSQSMNYASSHTRIKKNNLD